MQKHFLSIKNLSQKEIFTILEDAKRFQAGEKNLLLQDKWVANLFFEPSTRTRCSFEMAAKKLGAQVLNLDISRSSFEKGELLKDSIRTLEAMGCDIFVIRRSDEIKNESMINYLKQASLVNAGDGKNEHPSQAILDMLTISQYKKDFSTIRVAIVGDVKHSRVARSNIFALQILGVKNIRVIAPKALLPEDFDAFNIQFYEDLDQGLKDADVIMVLRVQKERMAQHTAFDSEDFSRHYCITTESLKQAKTDAIVMHPGPLNRDIEISSEVADGSQSVILQQVQNGVAARMAIFKFLFSQ